MKEFVLFFMQANLIVSLLQAIAQHTSRPRDHSRYYRVQYLKNIALATEQSDWLILDIMAS